VGEWEKWRRWEWESGGRWEWEKWGKMGVGEVEKM
jgi:hypothetical protein